MKKIRKGKDLSVTWTITTNGEVVSLEEAALTLYLVYPDRSKTEIEDVTIEGNVLTFAIGHDLQTMLGTYWLELWKDLDEDTQTAVDKVNAFCLVPLTTLEGGSDDSNLESASTDLGTDDISVGQTETTISVYDGLDSTSTSAALSANMGRELNESKQDALEYYTEDTDNEYVNIEASMIEVGDGQSNIITIESSATQSIRVVTNNGCTFTYNGSEVATASSVATAIADKQDTLAYYSEDTTDVASTLSADLIISAHNIEATNVNIGNDSADVWLYVSDSGIYYGDQDTTDADDELATIGDISTAMGSITYDDTPTSGSTNPVTSDGIYDALTEKEDALNWDSVPTADSNNPVRSKGIVTYVAAEISEALNFDTTPTSGSTNAVTSNGIYEALDDKEDTLTFDETPTSGSTNPVTSGGVYTAIQAASGLTTIVSVASGTTALTAEAGNSYNFADEVSSLTITLPTITGATTLQECKFIFTTASSTSVTITSGSTIYYQDGYSIEASAMYEVSAMWNGSAWLVASIVIATS